MRANASAQAVEFCCWERRSAEISSLLCPGFAPGRQPTQTRRARAGQAFGRMTRPCAKEGLRFRLVTNPARGAQHDWSQHCRICCSYTGSVNGKITCLPLAPEPGQGVPSCLYASSMNTVNSVPAQVERWLDDAPPSAVRH